MFPLMLDKTWICSNQILYLFYPEVSLKGSPTWCIVARKKLNKVLKIINKNNPQAYITTRK